MLTIDDVIDICEEGYEISLTNQPPSFYPIAMGYIEPDKSLINIYVDNIPSMKEYNITLLHEFIHAKNELGGFADHLFNEEDLFEVDAVETYNKTPEVAEFIIDLYDLKNEKF
ncbi:hypothetical protein HOD61_00590 [archaeon]|jgi:hypothetical protein|nr:hypothetical protein [archaeon]